MKVRRTISWLAACSALIALVALAIVFTTCGGGAERSESLGVPRAPILETGTTEWVHTWGGGEYDVEYPMAIAACGSNDVIITGFTIIHSAEQATRADVIVLRYDLDGSPIWARTWGGSDYDEAFAATCSPSGDIYVAGHTESFSIHSEDVLLLKYDSIGSLVWARTWGGFGLEEAKGITLDNDGLVCVSVQANGDSVLLKYDSEGNLVWSTAWGGREIEYAGRVAADAQGNIYVTGGTTSFGAGRTDVFLLKYSENGDLVWSRTWGGDGSEIVTAIVVDGNGSFYVAGSTGSFCPDGLDIFVLKFSSDGDCIWSRTWRGTANDTRLRNAYNWIEAVAVLKDGSIVLTGSTDSHRGMLFLMFDGEGRLVAQRVWDGDQRYPIANSGRALLADEAGNLIICGTACLVDGYWAVTEGEVSSPAGSVGIPDGEETVPEGTETIPEGTETAIEGVIDSGDHGWDILIMKYDPS